MDRDRRYHLITGTDDGLGVGLGSALGVNLGSTLVGLGRGNGRPPDPSDDDPLSPFGSSVRFGLIVPIGIPIFIGGLLTFGSLVLLSFGVLILSTFGVSILLFFGGRSIFGVLSRR